MKKTVLRTNHLIFLLVRMLYSAYICNIRRLQTIFIFTSIREAEFLPDLLLVIGIQTFNVSMFTVHPNFQYAMVTICGICLCHHTLKCFVVNKALWNKRVSLSWQSMPFRHDRLSWLIGMRLTLGCRFSHQKPQIFRKDFLDNLMDNRQSSERTS